MTRIATIIVAGGSGSRCGGGLPKQFRLLGGRPVLARTIDRMAEALPGAEIAVVLPEGYLDFWKNLAARFDIAGHAVVAGGEERFHSVRNGIEALRSDPELIVVQDGVRPLVTVETIRRVAAEAERSGAAIPVVLPVDSFREAEGERSHVVDRSRLRIVQTPQIFRADLLREAYRAEFDRQFTDDASAVERLGHPIALVEGDRTNLKLTTEEDFTLAEALLALRETPETDDEQL
ncbi:MAG: 2-C-methyl-D-erythritol 4-phosphate cytidylyltransferase [Alistipes sp.]|nr:2-C-methyl-D-erythritol 4-phosphate cytidylyltransferase [Alistipes sp.]